MTATARARKTPSPAAKTVVLLIGCAFGLNALAANNVLNDCDELPQDSRDLISPVQPLNANKTDHFLVPPADSLDSLTDLADIDPRTISPILSLTPRASILLDQVFETDSDASDLTKPKSNKSASPVADYVNKQNESEIGSDEELALPQIQQRMLRKDI